MEPSNVKPVGICLVCPEGKLEPQGFALPREERVFPASSAAPSSTSSRRHLSVSLFLFCESQGGEGCVPGTVLRELSEDMESVPGPMLSTQ